MQFPNTGPGQAGGRGGRGLYSHKILAATKIQTWKTFEIIQTLTTLWIVENVWKYIYMYKERKAIKYDNKYQTWR